MLAALTFMVLIWPLLVWGAGRWRRPVPALRPEELAGLARGAKSHGYRDRADRV